MFSSGQREAPFPGVARNTLVVHPTCQVVFFYTRCRLAWYATSTGRHPLAKRFVLSVPFGLITLPWAGTTLDQFLPCSHNFGSKRGTLLDLSLDPRLTGPKWLTDFGTQLEATWKPINSKMKWPVSRLCRKVGSRKGPKCSVYVACAEQLGLGRVLSSPCAWPVHKSLISCSF